MHCNVGERLNILQLDNSSQYRRWLAAILSLLFLLMGKHSIAQTTCRVVPGNISTLVKKDSESIDLQLKDISVDLSTKNTFLFCRANMMMRFLNSKNSPPMNCLVNNLKDLENKVDTFISDDLYWSNNRPMYRLYDSWNLAMMSTARSRNISIQLMYPGTERYLGKAYFQKTHIIPAEKEKIIGYFRNWMNQPIEDAEGLTKRAEKTAACISIGLLGDCIKSLDTIEKMMKPSYVSELSVTNLQGWRRFYEDTLLDQGLVLAAANLESIIESNQIAEKNIFDHLMGAFRQTAMNQIQAKEATWLVLGLIGTAGANTLEYVQSIEGWPNKISSKGLALGFIANSMTYLDYRNLVHGRPMFSYPANVKTSCDTAKPYHFWLTAHLARELVQKASIEPRIAMKTSFLAEQGYQIKRSLFMANGRNGISGVFSRSSYDPVHQIIRADLAYSAAGAFFGAYSGTSAPSKFLNVNQAIVDLLRDSEVLEPLAQKNTMGTLEAYRRFKKIFSPESAMKSFPLENQD